MSNLDSWTGVLSPLGIHLEIRHVPIQPAQICIQKHSWPIRACRLERVVRGGDRLVEVASNEGELLEDVTLDTGDTRGVEDHGEEGNATESTRLEAPAEV
jgi:hypothetical protein